MKIPGNMVLKCEIPILYAVPRILAIDHHDFQVPNSTEAWGLVDELLAVKQIFTLEQGETRVSINIVY